MINITAGWGLVRILARKSLKFYIRHPIAFLLIALYLAGYVFLTETDGIALLVYEFFITGHIICAVTLFKASNNIRALPEALFQIVNIRSPYFKMALTLTVALGIFLALVGVLDSATQQDLPNHDPGLDEPVGPIPWYLRIAGEFALLSLLTLLLFCKWLMYRMFGCYAIAKRGGLDKPLFLSFAISDQFKVLNPSIIVIGLVISRAVFLFSDLNTAMVAGSFWLLFLCPILLSEAIFEHKDDYGAAYV